MKKGVFLILIIFIMLLYPNIVFAENNEKQESSLFDYSVVGTTDTFVDLIATPGEKATFSIVLRNLGELKKTNTLFVSDGYTGNNGGTMVLTPEEATRKKVGSWLNITEEKVTLDSREEKVFDFIISVPQNATPGTYIAVIYLRSAVIDGKESEKNEKGIGFKINEAYSLSSAVIIRIGDETTYDFSIQDIIEKKWIKDKDLVFSFYISNIGNTYCYPNAKIFMYDNEDKLVYEAEKEINIVYPENTCRIDFLIPPEQYVQDTYRILLLLEYGKKEIKSISREFVLNLESKEVDTAIKEIEKEKQKNDNAGALTEETIYKIIIIAFLFLVVIILLIYFLFFKKKKKA